MKPPASTTLNWLANLDLSEPYVTTALQVLAARESQRSSARNASKEAAANARAGSPSPTSSGTSVLSRLTAEWKNRGYSSRHQRQEIPTEHVNHYSVAIAVSPENTFKNRYSNVEPYDRTRVCVQDGPQLSGAAVGGAHGRYLNASWVLERFGHKWWIAMQAPLSRTAHAFLSLLMQPVVSPPASLSQGTPGGEQRATLTSRPRTVVQLTQNVESGRRKADEYFPSVVGQSSLVPPEQGCQLPMLKVTLLAAETFPEAHCLRSTLSVTRVVSASTSPPPKDTYDSDSSSDDDVARYGPVDDVEEVGERVVFHHMLYESWPDHGVPQHKDRESLLAFVKLVDATNRDLSLCQAHGPTPSASHACDTLDPDPPMLVGCSAGIGRTGSFIALSSILREVGLLPPAGSPTPASVLPPSPLGPLPEMFQDDLVVQEVDSLREQRPGMVQRPEQMMLVYDVVMEAVWA